MFPRSARDLWLAPLLLALAPVASAQVESTFDTDLDGWDVVGDNAAAWQSVGGNPAGYLDVNDLVVGSINLAAAPPKFLGDWSGLTSADSLTYDLYFANTSGGTLLTPAYMVRLAGPGGSAHGIVPGVIPPQSLWTTFGLSLDPADWTIQSGTWSGLVADVQIIEIYAEFVSGAEEVRLDNVRLTGTPVPVFTPCAMTDFNDNTLGSWSFTGTGGVSNPTGDGNSLGYVNVAEGSGNAYAYAPARYLGDWSSYDGNGYLTIDVRVRGRSGTNLGSPDFITLSGPGGSAHVALAPGDIPVGSQNWVTYEFYLDSPIWTVDTGTWAALLADVTECRIDAEYFSSTETIGLDNFGRLMDGCSAIDAPVVVHAADVLLCGTHGLVDVSSAAKNPVDGLLYAVVDEQISNGGGFYPVDGTQAGVKISGLANGAQVVIDDDGDAFVSLDSGGTIQRFPLGGTAATWVSGFHSGDDDPFAMAFAPPGFNGANVSAGDIVVTDTGFNGPDEIWSFSPDVAEGELQVKPDPGANADWYGISDGPAGTMWMTDAQVPSTIFELMPDGSLVSTAVPLLNPRALRYVSGENAFYVQEVSTQSIYRLDASNWTATLVASGFRGISSAGVSVSQDEQRLIVVDATGDRVYEFCLPQAVAAPEGIRPPVDLPLVVAPNPFPTSTRVRFEIPARSAVNVTVYDVRGRAVRTLLQRTLPAGAHSVLWDGHSDGGRAAAGVYFVRLRSGESEATERMLLLR